MTLRDLNVLSAALLSISVVIACGEDVVIGNQDPNAMSTAGPSNTGASTPEPTRTSDAPARDDRIDDDHDQHEELEHSLSDLDSPDDEASETDEFEAFEPESELDDDGLPELEPDDGELDDDLQAPVEGDAGHASLPADTENDTESVEGDVEALTDDADDLDPSDFENDSGDAGL